MFGKKDEKPTPIVDVAKIRSEYEIEIAKIENDNLLALKEKEFELKHFKDEEIKKLNSEVAEKSKEIAVLKKENEMLAKITNLNADIIDIKDLVNKLVEKLPTINLSSLTLNGDREK